jgi:hypothetical protein
MQQVGFVLRQFCFFGDCRSLLMVFMANLEREDADRPLTRGGSGFKR